MAELVNKNIIDALQGSLDDFRIDNDRARLTETAPSLIHLFEFQIGQGGLQKTHRIKAHLESSGNNRSSMIAVPVFQQFFYLSLVFRICRFNLKVSAYQPNTVFNLFMNPQSGALEKNGSHR